MAVFLPRCFCRAAPHARPAAFGAAAAAAVLVLPLAGPGSPASLAGTGAGAEAPCSAPFDVLRAAPDVSGRCGVAWYPRQAGRSRPGGGTVYKYDLGAATVTYVVPPVSFDPLTASPQALRTYGLPPRPAAGRALAGWRRQMSGLHFVAPPPFLAEVPAEAASSTPDYSDHWAGYVDYGGPYKRASGTWVEPLLHRTRCRTTSVTMWTGIGGYASGSLAQDGTAEGTPEIGQNQAWWELTPAGMVPVPLYATVGAPFTADVTYLGAGRFSFFMENDSTHAAWSQVERSSNGASLSTAEAIVERPCLASCSGQNAKYSDLSNFGTIRFEDVTVDGMPIGSLDNYQERMSSDGIPFGPALAAPGALSSGLDGFRVQQHSCS